MLKKADIGVGLYLLAAVVFFIVPIPSVLLDVMLAFNISIALIIVFNVLFVREVLDMSFFPTLLLFTTIFRISLNVSHHHSSDLRFKIRCYAFHKLVPFFHGIQKSALFLARGDNKVLAESRSELCRYADSAFCVYILVILSDKHLCCLLILRPMIKRT